MTGVDSAPKPLFKEEKAGAFPRNGTAALKARCTPARFVGSRRRKSSKWLKKQGVSVALAVNSACSKEVWMPVLGPGKWDDACSEEDEEDEDPFCSGEVWMPIIPQTEWDDACSEDDDEDESPVCSGEAWRPLFGPDKWGNACPEGGEEVRSSESQLRKLASLEAQMRRLLEHVAYRGQVEGGTPGVGGAKALESLQDLLAELADGDVQGIIQNPPAIPANKEPVSDFACSPLLEPDVSSGPGVPSFALPYGGRVPAGGSHEFLPGSGGTASELSQVPGIETGEITPAIPGRKSESSLDIQGCRGETAQEGKPLEGLLAETGGRKWQGGESLRCLATPTEEGLMSDSAPSPRPEENVPSYPEKQSFVWVVALSEERAPAGGCEGSFPGEGGSVIVPGLVLRRGAEEAAPENPEGETESGPMLPVCERKGSGTASPPPPDRSDSNRLEEQGPMLSATLSETNAWATESEGSVPLERGAVNGSAVKPKQGVGNSDHTALETAMREKAFREKESGPTGESASLQGKVPVGTGKAPDSMVETGQPTDAASAPKTAAPMRIPGEEKAKEGALILEECEVSKGMPADCRVNPTSVGVVSGTPHAQVDVAPLRKVFYPGQAAVALGGGMKLSTLPRILGAAFSPAQRLSHVAWSGLWGRLAGSNRPPWAQRMADGWYFQNQDLCIQLYPVLDESISAEVPGWITNELFEDGPGKRGNAPKAASVVAADWGQLLDGLDLLRTQLRAWPGRWPCSTGSTKHLEARIVPLPKAGICFPFHERISAERAKGEFPKCGSVSVEGGPSTLLSLLIQPQPPRLSWLKEMGKGKTRCLPSSSPGGNREGKQKLFVPVSAGSWWAGQDSTKRGMECGLRGLQGDRTHPSSYSRVVSRASSAEGVLLRLEGLNAFGALFPDSVVGKGGPAVPSRFLSERLRGLALEENKAAAVGPQYPTVYFAFSRFKKGGGGIKRLLGACALRTAGTQNASPQYPKCSPLQGKKGEGATPGHSMDWGLLSKSWKAVMVPLDSDLILLKDLWCESLHCREWGPKHDVMAHVDRQSFGT